MKEALSAIAAVIPDGPRQRTDPGSSNHRPRE
jgi:hypothetical protein